MWLLCLRCRAAREPGQAFGMLGKGRRGRLHGVKRPFREQASNLQRQKAVPRPGSR